MKKLKENKKVLMIFGLLVLVLIAIGVTYAFFTYSKSGTTENTLKSGSITFWYDEQNREGNGISIEDALPLSDTDGKKQTKAFNFKIVSQTANSIAIPYEITLRQKTGTDNIGNIVKIYLAKTFDYSSPVNTEEEIKTSMFNSLPDTTHNSYSEKILHTDEVPQNSSNYEQNYRLKMWIDEKTDYSDGTYTGKTFTVMVNVYANGRITSSNTNINSVSVNNKILTAVNANEYETTLEPNTTSTEILVETEDNNSTVHIIKTESNYTTPIAEANNIERLSKKHNKTVDLNNGDNYFKIVVTSENNKNNKEIHLKVSVEDPTLKGRILKDNPTIYTNPTLTTSSNNTSDKDGLYSMTVTNGFGGQTATGTTYYFRGNVTNNYVKFAGLDWRVIRINEDGTIRLILDGSTDTASYAFNSSYQNYIYMYYSNSEVKSKVESWYNNNIGNNETYRSKIASGDYFCEAAKVKPESIYTSGSATMTVYSSYTPNLVCSSDDGNGKGLLNLSVGLINYDEVVLAGGYKGELNNNYYLYKNFRWWTMSTTGCYGPDVRIWNVRYDGILDINHAALRDGPRLRPVINLKADTTATKQEIDGKTYYVVD